MENTIPIYWVNCYLFIKNKRSWKWKKMVLFPKTKFPTHKFMISIATVDDCDSELVDNLPYSSDFIIIYSYHKK